MSGDPAFEAGYMFGRIAFPLLLIAGGIYLGRRLGRKQEPPRFVAWPVVVAIVLVVLGELGAIRQHGAQGAVPASEVRNG